MKASCVLCLCVLAAVSFVAADDQRDASMTCAVTGPHDCQMLVAGQGMTFRRGNAGCGDRNIIDLLWVYTPEALQYWGSKDVVDAKCAEAVADANLTFANTELPFSVRTVGIQLTDYVEPAEGYEYLGHLQDPSDGYMDEVHAIRDEVAADIVVLITVVGCGVAYVAAGNPDYAFQQCSVVCWPSAFRHELGHNLGSQHYVNDSYGYFSWSSGHRLTPEGGTEIGTAMGGNNIPYYSNPRVTYGGVPTGVAPGPDEEADNYLAFLATVPMAAAFRCSGDCNGNGIDDATELAEGRASDCDGNGVPDDCQIDFDENGVIDVCDQLPVLIRVPEDLSSIQVALSVAESGVHEIVVGPGSYVGLVDTLGKGVTVRSTLGAAQTTLDAAGGPHALAIRAGEGPTTVIDGFTIRGGSGNSYGGGIFINEASPTIRNCVVTENSSTYAGGGLRVSAGAPLIEGCVFTGNVSSYGGGVSSWEGAPRFVDCTFSMNVSLSGGHGGGYSSWNCRPEFAGCRFEGNTAETGTGGGLFTNSNAKFLPLISTTTFCENTPDDINSTAWTDGGGNQFLASCPNCLADLTNDGSVGGDDLTILLGAWGQCGLGCREDLDNNGAVDGADLTLLLAAWGACP